MTPFLPLVDVGGLGTDSGAHVPVQVALSQRSTGEELAVSGHHPDLLGGLASWCRTRGHQLRLPGPEAPDGAIAVVRRGPASSSRSVGASRSAPIGGDRPMQVASRAVPDWGLSARGAVVEPGGPEPTFRLDRRDEIWTALAPQLYRQALAGQWDPAEAIDWTRPENHPVIEAALVQVLTFLIENEEAALVVPARFLGQVHPHFREVQQMLATIAADEARHIEVFHRRIELTGLEPGLSSVSGRTSLQTLLDEPDFAIATFLLSVMGEGTFLSLLSFLERHAPDAVTRRISRLVRADESRHVAFGMGHLAEHAAIEPTLRSRLARAVEHRHLALQGTAGLNDDVFDALVLLAAGSTEPTDISEGWRAVQELQREMDDGRRGRLQRLGFTNEEADVLASLHTKNFM